MNLGSKKYDVMGVKYDVMGAKRDGLGAKLRQNGCCSDKMGERWLFSAYELYHAFCCSPTLM